MTSDRKKYEPDTMQVAVSVRGAVIVNDNVDAFHINASAEDIRGDKNTLLKRLERREAVDTRQSYYQPSALTVRVI
jgi:hypothetical protein